MFVDFDEDEPKKPEESDTPPQEEAEEEDSPRGMPGLPKGFRVLKSGAGSLPPQLRELLGMMEPPEGAAKTKAGGYITEAQLAEFIDFFNPDWNAVKQKTAALEWFQNAASPSAKHDAHCTAPGCKAHAGVVGFITGKSFRTFLNLYFEDDFHLFPSGKAVVDEYIRLWAIKDDAIAEDARFRVYAYVYNAQLLIESSRRRELPELPRV
jgi:hypothetical protein